MTGYTRAIQTYFTDKHGRAAIWQQPNIPLAGWLVFKLLAAVVPDGQFRTGSAHLATAFIFVWAYLELTSGASRFRKFLGFIVVFATTRGFFVS